MIQADLDVVQLNLQTLQADLRAGPPKQRFVRTSRPSISR